MPRASATKSGTLRRNAERERRERRWALHPAQYDFVESRERFAFYVGGIGAGKTFAGAVRAILRGQRQAGSLGLIGAPTYPMLRDTTQRTFFQLLPPGLVESFNKTDQHLVLTNGSEVLFRSLDQPDRVRGLNLAWFWLDEAPLCGYYAWQVLKGRLRQAGFDTAGWATGTPRGMDGYARDFEAERRAGHALYRASTQENAANLPEGFVADLGYTGDLAAQEIGGLFVAFSGLVYRLRPDVHVKAPPEGARWRRVVGGIDWGDANPTAALVFGLDGDGRAWQLDEYYKRRASLSGDRIPAIVAMTRRWGVERWYADPENPGNIDELNAALGREGLSCRAVGARKGPGSVRLGIQTVVGLLATSAASGEPREPKLHVSPGCVNTIAEYGVYRYASVPEGTEEKRDPRDEPIKQGDHAMDATRYALHGELGDAARTEAYLADMQERLRLMRARAGAAEGSYR